MLSKANQAGVRVNKVPDTKNNRFGFDFYSMQFFCLTLSID